MGKCCLHASSFIFDRIIIKNADNQERHKSSNKFDFGPDQDYSLWSYLPLNDANFTLSNLNISEASQPILIKSFCVASLGVGKGHIMFWGRLVQNSGVHGNRKPPLTYNGENGVFTISRLLLIWSFLYLQVTRTCIKSRRVWIWARSYHWLLS